MCAECQLRLGPLGAVLGRRWFRGHRSRDLWSRRESARDGSQDISTRERARPALVRLWLGSGSGRVQRSQAGYLAWAQPTQGLRLLQACAERAWGLLLGLFLLLMACAVGCPGRCMLLRSSPGGRAGLPNPQALRLPPVHLVLLSLLDPVSSCPEGRAGPEVGVSGHLHEEEPVRFAAAIRGQAVKLGAEGVGAVLVAGGVLHRAGRAVRGERGRGVVAEVVSKLEEARQTEPRVPLLLAPRHLEAVHEPHRVARDLDRVRGGAGNQWLQGITHDQRTPWKCVAGKITARNGEMSYINICYLLQVVTCRRLRGFAFLSAPLLQSPVRWVAAPRKVGVATARTEAWRYPGLPQRARGGEAAPARVAPPDPAPPQPIPQAASGSRAPLQPISGVIGCASGYTCCYNPCKLCLRQL